MTRPAGLIPEWASDASYPAGADPWSSTPTKVDPGATIIAAGFAPGDKLPAEFANWLFNQFSVWLGYQDTSEVRNWGETVEPGIKNAQVQNVIDWSPTLFRYFIGGTDSTDQTTPKVYRSINGITWVDDAAPDDSVSTGYFQVCCGADGYVLGWMNEGSGTDNYIRSPAGVWSANLGSIALQNLCAVYAGDVFVMGGTVSGPHPGARKIDPVTTVSTALVLPGSSGVSGSITRAATDGANVVLVSGTDVWYGTPAGAWTHVAAAFATLCHGLVWVDAEQLFWATCASGQVYTSPTGAVWTLRGAFGAFYDGLAALGGVVVGQTLVTGPSGDIAALAIGLDKGTTWDTVDIPLGSASGVAPSALCIVQVENRLVFVRKNGVTAADGLRLSYSLRVR